MLCAVQGSESSDGGTASGGQHCDRDRRADADGAEPGRTGALPQPTQPSEGEDQ